MSHAEHADPENPYAGQGSVLLDIGGDVGALVVTMPADLLGVEVEARPADPGGWTGHHPHVAVVARPGPAGPVPSLVFPELTEGSYVLCHKGRDEIELRVEVRGAQVTEEVWPGLSPPGD